ncbi:MAG: radical SAM protein [Deltaproteobacteria bacterium]|nr:radical SAM protein [Deltaproteobacteria bacterium]
MKDRQVVIIAMDQPLDSDAHMRGKMAVAEKRAARQSSRFPGLDLPGIQTKIHQNLLGLALSLNGRTLGLLDLLNFIQEGLRFPHLSVESAPGYHLFANEITLNGIYLYHYLLKHGYDPHLVQNYSLTRPLDIVREKPLAVCISSTFLYLDHIREIASRIKELDPEVPVIVGGILVKKVLNAGPDLAPQTLRWLSGFQGKVDAFVVESHGEESLLRLLDALRSGQDVTGLPNLALFDREGRLFFTARHPEIGDMDGTAIPWDEIPRAYLRNTISVATSRGCYYRCRFCTYHRWFPQVNYKSLDVLKDELRRIKRLGFVRHVRFADDNFTARRDRLMAVLEMMIREDLGFTWSSYARATALTPDVVKLMKASGCDLLVMGIESGSPAILRNMDKRLRPEQALKAVRLLRDQGIDSQGAFVIGYPGETAGTFRETIEFINESGLDYYHPYLFYYSKEMLVHEERERFGLEGLGLAWRHKTMDSVEASELMSRMISLIPGGFTDGQQNTWETYKILRGEGYSREEIRGLHRLKRELQMAIGDRAKGGADGGTVDTLLREAEARLRR